MNPPDPSPNPRTKPATKSSITPEEYAPLRGRYPSLDEMVRLKQPLTRDVYLSYELGDEASRPLTPEEELEIPPPFRAQPTLSPIE